MLTKLQMFMILFSVTLSALAQIMLKAGMSGQAVQHSIAIGQAGPVILAVVTSFKVWAGLFLYGSSAVMWLFVLAFLDVSVAYAFVSLGFLITMALGCLLLGEPFTLRKLCGTVLLMFSIMLVARSA